MDVRSRRLEDGTFLLVVAIVTALFFWLALPYFGAILWGVVAAILFTPVYRKLAARLRGRRNIAAGLTLVAVLALVVVPAIVLAIALVQEATVIYANIQTGSLDIAEVIGRLRAALPDWAADMLGNDFDIERLRQMLGSALATGAQSIAGQALLFGQGALGFLAALFVMLYLTYFLLRDGDVYGRRIKAAIPLEPALRDRLLADFVTVVRATMKGSVVVAVIQGLLGGIIFWLLGIEGALLWGLLMGFFSLVPAIGTGIVWVPVAVYLFATGSATEGGILVFCGIFVIGMVDNVLRPILVGKDTKLPDFVVLISTVAGLELFGISGFIIGPVIAALFVSVWRTFTELRLEQAEAV
jgi:predicted PurR-regulated permease PerM